MTGNGQRDIDSEFLALPLQPLADAALQAARDGGATYAAFRMERILGTSLRLRDAEVEGVNDTEDVGYSVRVVLNGTWGFAADIERTPEAAARTAKRALDLAKVSAPVNTEPVDLTPEPAHQGTWCSSYDIDPWSVPHEEKLALLQAWSRDLLNAPGINHVDTSLLAVKENKFYADLAGTVTTQQRVRLHPEFNAVAIDPG
ncbi:MAG: DNA gyrase modulator, partial [Actinomycetes bacterium]